MEVLRAGDGQAVVWRVDPLLRVDRLPSLMFVLSVEIRIVRVVGILSELGLGVGVDDLLVQPSAFVADYLKRLALAVVADRSRAIRSCLLSGIGVNARDGIPCFVCIELGSGLRARGACGGVVRPLYLLRFCCGSLCGFAFLRFRIPDDSRKIGRNSFGARVQCGKWRALGGLDVGFFRRLVSVIRRV